MFKALAMGMSLSLFSLSTWAFPETIDVSGIEIGSDMQEAAAKLQDKYPDKTPKVFNYEDGGVGRIILRREWDIRPVQDDSGRVGMIKRIQKFDDENIGLEATLEALRNKYGQEPFHEDKARTDWYDLYWAEQTDNQYDAFWGSYALYERAEFNKDKTENVRAAVRVQITTKQDGELVKQMTTSVYWTQPAHDHALAYITEQREKEEAERQRNLEEAKNNPADI